jgi:hypothetical protein
MVGLPLSTSGSAPRRHDCFALHDPTSQYSRDRIESRCDTYDGGGFPTKTSSQREQLFCTRFPVAKALPSALDASTKWLPFTACHIELTGVLDRGRGGRRGSHRRTFAVRRLGSSPQIRQPRPDALSQSLRADTSINPPRPPEFLSGAVPAQKVRAPIMYCTPVARERWCV